MHYIAKREIKNMKGAEPARIKGTRFLEEMRQVTLFDEEDITGVDENAPEVVQNAWRKAKQDMKRNFKELQDLPYEAKIERQTRIAWEFHEEMQKRECGCHVSVGGLDSITLYIWLKV